MELLDWSQIGRFVAALAFVLGLMLGLSAIMRRVHGGTAPLPGARKRRLRIVESLTLDARHRAVLLRRDDREHLVILGANGDTVIETAIESPQDEPHDPLHEQPVEKA
jgi:flagellar protein FliO/FliZ